MVRAINKLNQLSNHLVTKSNENTIGVKIYLKHMIVSTRSSDLVSCVRPTFKMKGSLFERLIWVRLLMNSLHNFIVTKFELKCCMK